MSVTKAERRAARAYKVVLRRQLKPGRKAKSNIIYVNVTGRRPHILCACIGQRDAKRINRALEGWENRPR